MARVYGSTASRGYGSPHAKLRAQWKPLVESGQVQCHAIICLEERDGATRWIPPGAPWHLGHTADRSGWTGPEHQRCGAADGARRGNQQRPRRIVAALGPGRSPLCASCGKEYHYAGRPCEMCGLHYHPSYGQQRTCSRACGLELKRRNGNMPKPRPRPPCKVCGQPCNGLGKTYCSPECSGYDYRQQWPSSPLHHYTCRYCGKPGIEHGRSGARREVCPARECQLARLAANNLRVRQGLTAEEADAQVTSMLGAPAVHGKWAAARRW